MKIRLRVGINHVTLAGFLNAVIRSGFTITTVEEPGDADPPFFLALRMTKPREHEGSLHTSGIWQSNR